MLKTLRTATRAEAEAARVRYSEESDWKRLQRVIQELDTVRRHLESPPPPPPPQQLPFRQPLPSFRPWDGGVYQATAPPLPEVTADARRVPKNVVMTDGAGPISS